MHTVLMTLAVAVTMSAPVPKQKPAAVYFPTAVGTRWEYATPSPRSPVDVWEVTERTEKDGEVTVIVEVKDGQSKGSNYRYKLKDGGVYIERHAGGTEYTPPLHFMNLTPRAGDKWEARAKTHPRAQTPTTYQIEAGEAKMIETPAGKFLATPVSYRLPGGVNLISTEWYADGVGMVREEYANGTVVRDLKAFTPGKGEKKDEPKKDK